MKRWLVMLFVLCFMFSSTATAEDEYNWIMGGEKVDLGNIATIDLDTELVFLNGNDTQKMAAEYGDPVSGLEIGSIYPMDENQNWAVIFEYEETGHINDDEKADIDAKALLKSYKKGTEEANKERQPGDRFYVTGWDIEPFYDDKTHNLTWSLLLEDENKEPFLNYNTRILTREGTISTILITDPQNRETDKKIVNEKIMSMLQVKAGEKYEDFNESTDKVAEYGLTALILGGAGLAVAKKAGLMAALIIFVKKFGILAVAGIGALFGLVKKKKKNAAKSIDNTINE